MQKDMDRRDFLKHVGIGFAAIAGVTTILKTLNTLNGQKEVTVGYGSSAYGGSSKASTQTQTPTRKTQA